ncbi:MAG TPA: PrsW family glutamic-type intramembrane protease [Solirubrobacteraceae bacterium]|nr:PrsW family glutamic-type intramembrane protease [Solirubrobacteraceae bacterium]
MGEPGAWRATLALGLVLWAAAVALFAVTENVIVLPSVILLGSFLVPVVAVEWWWDRRAESALSVPLLARVFLVAGTGGLFAAAALETWLLPGRSIEALWVAGTEETVKLLLVLGAAACVPRLRPLDGLILGATVGFGFAAFESAGYALNAAIRDGDFDFRALVENELLRAVEAPFLHGAWTGAVGGALALGRRRLVAVTLVAVVVLHALWDASSAAALALVVLLDGDAGQAAALDAGVLPDPRGVSPWLYGALQNAIQITVALGGALVLRRLYRRAANGPP